MKRFISCFLIIILCVFIFSSCLNRGDNGGPTLSVTQPVSVPDSTQNVEDVTGHENSQDGESVPQTTAASPDITTEAVTSASNKTDEKMVFSSDPNNIFISAVVSKYGVNSANLVVYYASSGTSNANLVYEFNGAVGTDGRPIRTKDTLKNIYTVSAPPELLAKKASGTAAEGNEYNERDTKLCKYFTDYVVFRFFADDIQNA